jgi:ligand-binding SRPBCC domain-containing protein
VESFIRTTTIEDVPRNEVFSWHTREGAFERLNPPWQPFTVIERKGGIQNNGIVKIRMNFGLLRMNWIIKHADYIEGKQFRDVQISGPFSSWTHTHLFDPISALH